LAATTPKPAKDPVEPWIPLGILSTAYPPTAAGNRPSGVAVSWTEKKLLLVKATVGGPVIAVVVVAAADESVWTALTAASARPDRTAEPTAAPAPAIAILRNRSRRLLPGSVSVSSVVRLSERSVMSGLLESCML
jgi:hypothetical protein